MNKIGILTFHRAPNYGAMLQTFALQTALEQLGALAEVVDYKMAVCRLIINPIPIIKENSLFGFIRWWLNRFPKLQVNRRFRNTCINTGVSYNRKSIRTACNEYKFFLVGSDQVWNPQNTEEDDSIFLLAFADDAKKYSYAASLGFNEFPEDKKEFILNNLRKFQSVSVREESGKELLLKEKITARVDMDPVFLLSSNTWRTWADPRPKQGGYILIYTVERPSEQSDLFRHARSLSREQGLPVIYLNAGWMTAKGMKKVRYVSPQSFVNWFANATYIYTNSFHGTAFSIIFEKRFKVKFPMNGTARIQDLLSRLSLTKAALCEDTAYDFNYDWELARQSLETHRMESLKYLKELVRLANT